MLAEDELLRRVPNRRLRRPRAAGENEKAIRDTAAFHRNGLAIKPERTQAHIRLLQSADSKARSVKEESREIRKPLTDRDGGKTTRAESHLAFRRFVGHGPLREGRFFEGTCQAASPTEKECDC